jgi:hypothetical protein
MRRGARTDGKHAEILADLRSAGFSVADTHALGKDFPDAAIARRGICALLEIKTPRGRKTAEQRLSDGQSEFAKTWNGPVIAAFTTEEVMYKFGALLKRSGYVR